MFGRSVSQNGLVCVVVEDTTKRHQSNLFSSSLPLEKSSARLAEELYAVLKC